MSRVKRVEQMLQAIEYETSLAFNEHTVLLSKNQELEAENAKLRELVRQMWLHSYCSIAKTRDEDDRHIEDVIDRMRELGIEVEP